MARVKTPLLSFRADGSIGKQVTFAQTTAGQIAKSIPSHYDANTYPQRLQRSRFLDAIYYWRSLSSAAREAYKVTARPLNMTGWAYYLSQYLPNPPDQVLWLPLDHTPGGIALDRSPQANNGTVFGAVPRTDLIDRCIDLDGIDDRATIPSDPSLDFTTGMTAMCWLRPFQIQPGAVQESLITKRKAPECWQAIIWLGHLRFTFWKGGVNQDPGGAATLLTSSIPQHLAITFDNITVSYYLNGLPDGSAALAGPIDVSDTDILLGVRDPALDPYHGRQDEPRLYNRCLSPQHVYAIAHGLYYPETLI